MKTFPIMFIAAATLLSACGDTSQKTAIKQTVVTASTGEVRTEVVAQLFNNAKELIGVATVDGDEDGGVRLRVQAISIPPGPHGMHFHEKADCSSPDFKSAGGHINPMKMKHGLNNPDGPDNADMENAVADENGNLQLERLNPRVSMNGGGGLPALLDDDGSALVIHINPDDQITQPIGGAGARIACAEIQQ